VSRGVGEPSLRAVTNAEAGRNCSYCRFALNYFPRLAADNLGCWNISLGMYNTRPPAPSDLWLVVSRTTFPDSVTAQSYARAVASAAHSSAASPCADEAAARSHYGSRL
jgi:hypothetical protein